MNPASRGITSNSVGGLLRKTVGNTRMIVGSNVCSVNGACGTLFAASSLTGGPRIV